MSDINNGTSQRDVDKIINEALKAWEKYGFKYVSLWETFQEDFEGFTEEDFRLTSNYNIRRLCDYPQKFSVWIQKQQKYTIARSLYEAVLEEEPTEWTEEEIMACKLKKEFASYHIKQLVNSDFGRKPEFGTFTPISPSEPPPAPAPFASPSSTPCPSAPAPVNTSINPTQPPGTGPTPAAYTQPPDTGPTPAAYTPPGTGPTPAGHTQPSTEPARAVQNPPSAIFPPAATRTTSTGHGRELSNLTKIYTDEAKYSGRNDSFIFKLAIFHDICSRADVPSEAKLKAFPTMLKSLALDYYYSNMNRYEFQSG